MVLLEIGLDTEVFDGRDQEQRAEDDQDRKVAPGLAHGGAHWPDSIGMFFQILFLQVIQVHVGESHP